WIVPAKVGGTWKLPNGDLMLKQTFQMISGTLKSGNVIAPINGKLNGDQITFSAGEGHYTGRVNGNSMAGILKSGGKWSATRTTSR
ncbi:MAG: SAM-dependent methyltransferase, partial [Candidatus Binatia bacterium]